MIVMLLAFYAEAAIVAVARGTLTVFGAHGSFSP
jgi:hypothetical protein